MPHKPTIGLEIHVELKTNSKMFCGCANDALEKRPNFNICPICTGQPGTLPLANKKAIELLLKAALALNCEINKFSKFDRKNYFYPDLPKGYQISQYDEPFSKDGYLEIPIFGDAVKETGERESKTKILKMKKIRIRRIHLEEDTGKLLHPEGADYSLVDYNRAGAPLMELVTEPDITAAGEAKKFCQDLQLIFRYLEISDADMEKGQMRCEVNISLSDNDKLGTKVEIKNLNSFRAVEKSIEYEINRQRCALENGEKIIQETRGWNADKEITFSQRAKEEAHDYRYFPEPDLPPLDFNKSGIADIKEIKSRLPELPEAKRKRFLTEYRLPLSDIETLVNNKKLADYFESVISDFKQWLKENHEMPKQEEKRFKLIKLAANYTLTHLFKMMSDAGISIDDLKLNPENFAEFIVMVSDGRISSSAAQKVLAEMFSTGADPEHIIESKGLTQVNDESALEKAVSDAIKNNPVSVGDYKSGKKQALQFLVGQTMKATKGKANPQIVAKMLKDKLS